jgi:hypothetical protein
VKTSQVFLRSASVGSAQLASVLHAHGVEFASFARRANPEIVRLEAVLAEIESRLGTAEERETDFETCRDLAHRLASLFCIGALLHFPNAQRVLGLDRASERVAC